MRDSSRNHDHIPRIDRYIDATFIVKLAAADYQG